MSDVTCIHGSPDPSGCLSCAALARGQPRDLTSERRRIVEYLEWAAGIELGTVLSPEERQGVFYAAAWVRNELDKTCPEFEQFVRSRETLRPPR